MGKSIFLLFLVYMAALSTEAQIMRTLVAEKIDNPKKQKIYNAGDFVMVHSVSDDKVYSGNISAIRDSSIVIGNEEIKLSDVDYITERISPGMLVKFVGGVATVVGGIVIGIGLWMVADGWATVDSQNAVLLGTTVPIITGLGIYALTRKSKPRRWGEATGWKLGITRFYIGYPAVIK